MKKDKVGVIIGRFQPFHLGHSWLIKRSLEKFSKLIILIGSSNIEDENNLWDLEKRVEMLNAFIKHEGLEKKIIKIDDVIDIPDDDMWLLIALEKIGNNKFVVIGDNEWVNKIFEKAGYKVWRSGYFDRARLQGVKIRKLMKNKKKWQDTVPEYLIELINK